MYNITLNNDEIFKIYNSNENVADKILTLYFDPNVYSLETITKKFFNTDIKNQLTKIIKTDINSSFIAVYKNYTYVASVSTEMVDVIVENTEEIPTLDENNEKTTINVNIPESKTIELIVVRLKYENPTELLVQNLNEQINPSIDIEACSLEELKRWQKKEINNACFKEIENGVDVKLSDNKNYHFSYKLEDQINYTEIYQEIEFNGCTNIPYHPDGGDCTLYSVDDIKRVITAQRSNKFMLTTKCNSYYNMINNALTKEDVLKITWGSELSSDDLNIYNNFVTSVAVK